MSQDDEVERQSERHLGYEDEDDDEEDEYEDARYDDPEKEKRKTRKWRQKVEVALVKMTAEMAALREQIATGREYRGRKRRSVAAWIWWFVWVAMRHMLVDSMVLAIVLLWMRKKKDRRLEDLFRAGVKLGREYARKILPAR